MQVRENVVYDAKTKNTCDIYSARKTQEAAVPCVLIVHGGAWMMGNKKRMAHIARNLCMNTGFVCIVPDYSLSQLDTIILQNVVLIDWGLLAVLCVIARKRSTPLFFLLCVSIFITVCVFVHLMYRSEKKNNAHPAHVLDIAQCIRWAVALPTPLLECSADMTNLTLVGHSAGAHLCALVVLNPRFLLPTVRQSIRRVVCMSGLYSFWRLQDSFILRHVINRGVFAHSSQGLTRESFAHLWKMRHCMCRQFCASMVARWDNVLDAWPLFWTSSSSSNSSSSKPAFLILTAELDLSLILHAKDFVDSLAIAGFDVQHLHFSQTTHFSIHHFWDSKHSHIANAIHEFLTH